MFTTLSGENIEDILDLAGKPHDIDLSRMVLHCSIIYANEVGHPKGQELQPVGVNTDYA